VDGVSISNIEWSDKVGATKATVTKDGQFSTLTFNQALLSQPIANAPQAPQPAPSNNHSRGSRRRCRKVCRNRCLRRPAARRPLTCRSSRRRFATATHRRPPRVRSVIQRNPQAPASAACRLRQRERISEVVERRLAAPLVVSVSGLRFLAG
jgi:hypothetical protein